MHQRHMDQAARFRDVLFDNTLRGAVVLMDETTRTRISADVLRLRRLVPAFPVTTDSAEALKRLEEILRTEGVVYVTRLDLKAADATSPDPCEERTAFTNAHPHTVMFDEQHDGWRLRITRVLKAGPL